MRRNNTERWNKKKQISKKMRTVRFTVHLLLFHMIVVTYTIFHIQMFKVQELQGTAQLTDLSSKFNVVVVIQVHSLRRFLCYYCHHSMLPHHRE